MASAPQSFALFGSWAAACGYSAACRLQPSIGAPRQRRATGVRYGSARLGVAVLPVLVLAPACTCALRQVVPQFTREDDAEAQGECRGIAGAIRRLDALAAADYATRSVPCGV